MTSYQGEKGRLRASTPSEVVLLPLALSVGHISSGAMTVGGYEPVQPRSATSTAISNGMSTRNGWPGRAIPVGAYVPSTSR